MYLRLYVRDTVYWLFPRLPYVDYPKVCKVDIEPDLQPSMDASPQRKTAEALVASFNNMDVDATMSYRSQDCLRHLLPSTMKQKPQDNDTYSHSLKQLQAIFQSFSLTIDDLLEDTERRRIALWLTARGDTSAGEYFNEYVWLLDFDETGTKIVSSKEYSDSMMNRDFYPKLQAAMQKLRAEQAGDGEAME